MREALDWAQTQKHRLADLGRAVVCQSLRSRAAQITYLQKFQTCHRPGEAGFNGRGRAYPMKPEQIAQLAEWTKSRRFEEFLFMLGFRRRGSRFETQPEFDQAFCKDRRGERARDAGGDGDDGAKRYLRNP